MKILFSLTYYHPYISGLSLYVKSWAEEMANRGHEVRVVCIKHDRDLKDEEILNQVTIKRIGYWFRIHKGFLSGEWLTKTIKEVAWAEKIVICLPQVEGAWIAGWAKIWGKWLGVNYLSEVSLPAGIMNRAVQNCLDLSHRLTLGWANSVVTYAKEYAQSSRLLSRKKWEISYVLPPVKKPTAERRLSREIWAKVSGVKWRIGWIGRLAAEKGVEYLIGAMEKLEKNLKGGFVMVLAGPPNPVGENEYRTKIMKLIGLHPGKILQVGELPEESKGSFYENIDVLVLPSINGTEGFGMVQVEAMAWRVPVVASNLPGVNIPITVTGKGLLVTPGNTQELGEAVSEVLKNRSKYKPTGEEAEKYFGAKKSFDKLEKWLATGN